MRNPFSAIRAVIYMVIIFGILWIPDHVMVQPAPPWWARTCIALLVLILWNTADLLRRKP